MRWWCWRELSEWPILLSLNRTVTRDVCGPRTERHLYTTRALMWISVLQRVIKILKLFLCTKIGNTFWEILLLIFKNISYFNTVINILIISRELPTKRPGCFTRSGRLHGSVDVPGGLIRHNGTSIIPQGYTGGDRRDGLPNILAACCTDDAVQSTPCVHAKMLLAGAYSQPVAGRNSPPWSSFFWLNDMISYWFGLRIWDGSLLYMSKLTLLLF